MLWKKIEREPKRTSIERRQDDWLWKRVKGLTDSSAGAVDNGMEALGEISDAVKASYADDEERLSHEAQQSFAPVHSRLMEAIEASKHVATDAATPRASGVFASPKAWFSHRRPTARLQWAVSFCLLAAVAGGAHEVGRLRGGHESGTLPVQSMVDDFDANLRSPSPFDFVAYRPEDNQQAAAWLSQSVGSKVELPAPTRAGVRLLGARRHTIQDKLVAQTHYSKDGVPIALYQVRDPSCGLANMNEARVGSHLFLTSNRGNYRVVAWRSGEVVMTMVSPLGMESALQLADAMRSNQDPLI